MIYKYLKIQTLYLCFIDHFRLEMYFAICSPLSSDGGPTDYDLY
jgi:hypothetical protein